MLSTEQDKISGNGKGSQRLWNMFSKGRIRFRQIALLIHFSIYILRPASPISLHLLYSVIEGSPISSMVKSWGKGISQRWPHVLLFVAFAYVSVLIAWTYLYSSSSVLSTRKFPAPMDHGNPSATPVKQVSRRHQCVAWRATGNCSPDSPREPQNDKNCSDTISGFASGFCELEDIDTGERLHVMQKFCRGLSEHVTFQCSDAVDFANYHVEGQKAVEKALDPSFSSPRVATSGRMPRDGIVIVVYPKLLASAYATVRLLRQVHQCHLPIEIWYDEGEFQANLTAMAPLRQLATSVGNITFQPIDRLLPTGYYAKVSAIYNSTFDRVLFLDADNVPVRDPSFLFTTPEFETHGAIFWPDFWHPRNTIFNMNNQSMLWELLDVPFVDMFEQESGQVLVDRTRHATPLELLVFYAFHEPNMPRKLDVIHGDKDLFRLAWMKLNATFHMIDTPPAMAGRLLQGSFCGMTMVQHDPQGQELFLHRNLYKLTGKRDEKLDEAMRDKTVDEAFGAPNPDGYPDPVVWTHLQSFHTNASHNDYVIDRYQVKPQFPEWQTCFGRQYPEREQDFELKEFSSFSFNDIEENIRRFAFEAL